MELIIDVIGMKCFKGVVDGQAINSGAVYSLVRLDERFNKIESDSTNWKTGSAIEEWKVGDAQLVLSLASLKPSVKNPVPMRLEIERVSNGRDTREVVVGIQPVNAPAVDQSTGEIKPQPVRRAA